MTVPLLKKIFCKQILSQREIFNFFNFTKPLPEALLDRTPTSLKRFHKIDHNSTGF